MFRNCRDRICKTNVVRKSVFSEFQYCSRSIPSLMPSNLGLLSTGKSPAANSCEEATRHTFLAILCKQIPVIMTFMEPLVRCHTLAKLYPFANSLSKRSPFPSKTTPISSFSHRLMISISLWEQQEASLHLSSPAVDGFGWDAEYTIPPCKFVIVLVLSPLLTTNLGFDRLEASKKCAGHVHQAVLQAHRQGSTGEYRRLAG